MWKGCCSKIFCKLHVIVGLDFYSPAHVFPSSFYFLNSFPYWFYGLDFGLGFFCFYLRTFPSNISSRHVNRYLFAPGKTINLNLTQSLQVFKQISGEFRILFLASSKRPQPHSDRNQPDLHWQHLHSVFQLLLPVKLSTCSWLNKLIFSQWSHAPKTKCKHWC